MKLILSLLLLAVLASCSAYKTNMVNDWGGTATCESKSFAGLGSWRAGALNKQCVEDFKVKGYREEVNE